MSTSEQEISIEKLERITDLGVAYFIRNDPIRLDRKYTVWIDIAGMVDRKDCASFTEAVQWICTTYAAYEEKEDGPCL